MNRNDPETIATAFIAAIDAFFRTIEAAYLGLFRSIMWLILWTGIIGFGLIFLVNTIGYEINAPGASLELSRTALLFSIGCYCLRSVFRAG